MELDADALLERVAPDGLSVCLAEYLPDTIGLDALQVGDGAASVAVAGEGVTLNEEALARHGGCD